MLKPIIAILICSLALLSGCAAVPFGIGLIPGAPAYVSSVIGGGQTMYTSAMDERDTDQQMIDAVIAGHAQAELYKNKDIKAGQISTYSYFNKLYLVGEYESQEQLRTIYESVEKVDNKRAVINCLYLKKQDDKNEFFNEQATYADLQTQLMADFNVNSTPVEVEIVQGDIILLGVVKDKKEREQIMVHALAAGEGHRVLSYLYHQENGGPEPHIMTADLPPAPDSKIPPPPKKRVVKKKTRPKVVQKKTKAPVLAVTNPDRGR